ncbi:MAG: AAA family ATPase [Candidatus Limnocylindria bacterium]
MPSNPILICAREATLRGELEASLGDAGYVTASVGSPADAVAAMRARNFDLIVAEGLAASGAIASLRTAGSAGVVPILVVAPANDVEARIAFLEAGADDVIVGGFAHSELDGRVMAQLIRAGKIQMDSSSHSGSAEIVAFFSPKGGVGTTTLAVNTAVLLAGGGSPLPAAARAAESGFPPSRVLLVDLDLQFGQVATHLNLTPRYDIGGLASDEPALADAELARMYLTTHSSGLVVLAAPTRPEADFRVTLEHLQRIFEVMRPSFDHIIVDLGSRLDPRAVWILEQADAHVFVLFPEIAALRAMSMLMTFLAETTPLQARAAIVVNHVFPKELLKTRDVENLLRTKPAAEIPYTEVEMIRSVNEGVPLVIGRPASPATIALRKVAQAVIGIEQQQAAPSKKPGRRSIFSRR